MPGIFLGVAAFLLHIVLSRLTAMQRTQIGLLKAFGYSNREVGLHYLKLALVTVLAGLALGGALGLYAGTWLTEVYRDYYRFPRLAFEVSPHVLSLTLLIALAAAASARSARCAGRSACPRPKRCARSRPPASMQGLLERTGLSARLPSSARMIARSIARRRGKSSLAVLGIGCAVGILVVGRFGLDAMSYMLQVQFEVVQRDDVTVIFTEPESAGVRHELTRLPGVLGCRALSYRAGAAALRASHQASRADRVAARWGAAPAGGCEAAPDTASRQRRSAHPQAGRAAAREAGRAHHRVGARRRAPGAHPAR